MEPTEYTYELDIRDDVRRYHRRLDDPYYREPEDKYGLAWTLVRLTQGDDGKEYRQSIFASAEIFDTYEEAADNAQAKLAIVQVSKGDPVGTVLRSLLDR